MRSRSLIWSFNYAIEGVVYALRTQRNMRLHVASALLALLAALILNVSRYELIAIIFAISLVFVTELVNTAVEATVDLATETYSPVAKIAKDVSAGAVLVAATNAVVIAFLVLFDPLRLVLQNGLNWVGVAATGLTAVALAFVLLGVIIMKAGSREGTFLHGGWPSGHTALAFGAATALGFVTGSVGALLLAFFIATLVAQSRIEMEVHTVAQAALGALLGVLIVTATFQVFFR